MGDRVKFLSGGQTAFLSEVSRVSDLSTNDLARLAGVVPRSYRDWKRENLKMPLEVVELFGSKFNISLAEDKEVLVNRWRRSRRKANRKGGLARFRKHGSPATLEGRKKGGSRAMVVLRERGIIPNLRHYNLPEGYSEDLAEYLGILLGDGGLTPYQCFVTLNSKADKDYIPFVVSLGKQLFGVEARISKRKDKQAIVIYYNGKNLVNYLVGMGLKIGSKVRQQAGIPGWVRECQEYKTACLRGLMDTDGGVFLHKYKVGGKKYVYKKLCFSNRSLPILLFVTDVLKGLELNPRLVTNIANQKVWLYNKDEVEQYLNLVSTHNPRLLKHQDIEFDWEECAEW